MKMRDEPEEEEELEQENATSECSSGCQSGWTMYLDQSNEEEPRSPPYSKVITVKENEAEEEEEEEEDLSMVSDASSGPPHFLEEDQEHYTSTVRGKKRRVEVESSPFLDDTASSPFFTLPKTSSAAHKVTKEELSCGFSTTHFKRMPSFGRHLGYSQFPTPAPTRSACRGEGEKKLR